MAVGLFDKKILLNLKPNNTLLIYDIIYHNYISILNTVRIINGKLFINWINVTPFNLTNYKRSNLYLNTIKGIQQLKQNFNENNFDYYQFSDNYNGLWIGDFYNVYQTVLYQSIKK